MSIKIFSWIIFRNNIFETLIPIQGTNNNKYAFRPISVTKNTLYTNSSYKEKY